jgi:hypothetical protein
VIGNVGVVFHQPFSVLYAMYLDELMDWNDQALERMKAES